MDRARHVEVVLEVLDLAPGFGFAQGGFDLGAKFTGDDGGGSAGNNQADRIGDYVFFGRKNGDVDAVLQGTPAEVVRGGEITAGGEKATEQAKGGSEAQNRKNEQQEIDKERRVRQWAIAGQDDRTRRAGEADGGENKLQENVQKPEQFGRGIRIADGASEGVEGDELDDREAADQRQEHVKRGDVFLRGGEDGACAAENEDEGEEGEEKVDAQALALAQGLLKRRGLALQMVHESSGSRRSGRTRGWHFREEAAETQDSQESGGRSVSDLSVIRPRD